MGKGKKRSQSQITGELGVNFLRKILPNEWVLREYTPDYGIDISVEIFEKYKKNYITTGEHIYFQVKGTYNLEVGKLKVFKRMNVEKGLIEKELYKEIEVVKFPLETSLLATVERMGSAVPVILIIVDLHNEESYFICLNDYIEKFIVPNTPNYTDQKKLTINIPLHNKIRSSEDVLPISWYSKRAKLFALFSKVNYQNYELNYFNDNTLKEDIIHFMNIILRSDAWSASNYFYALKNVKNDFEYFLKTGNTQWANQTIIEMQKRGEDVDEEVWETNNTSGLLSYRDAQNAIGLRHMWNKLCNCGNILEDLAKEWFLPTYIGLITNSESYKDS